MKQQPTVYLTQMPLRWFSLTVQSQLNDPEESKGVLEKNSSHQVPSMVVEKKETGNVSVYGSKVSESTAEIQPGPIARS